MSHNIAGMAPFVRYELIPKLFLVRKLCTYLKCGCFIVFLITLHLYFIDLSVHPLAQDVIHVILLDGCGVKAYHDTSDNQMLFLVMYCTAGLKCTEGILMSQSFCISTRSLAGHFLNTCWLYFLCSMPRGRNHMYFQSPGGDTQHMQRGPCFHDERNEKHLGNSCG